MIYFPDRNLVIVTPFKCGSTSLHNHLCSPAVGGLYVIGVQQDGEIDKHTLTGPRFGDHGRANIAIVVRNPVNRLRSIVSYSQLFEPEISFHEVSQRLSGGLCANQSTLIDESNANQYWKLEHIDDCLNAAGLPSLARRDNRSANRSDLNEEQIESVRWWWEPDAERFGY